MRLTPLMLATCFIALNLAPPARSEDGTLTKPFSERRGLGFAAGPLSGIGLTWRETNPQGWGFQASGGIVLTNFSTPVPTWSLGIQGIKVLHETRGWRLYAVAGLGALGWPMTIYEPLSPPADPSRDGYGVQQDTSSPQPQPSPTEVPIPPTMPNYHTEMDHFWHLGGGIGMEWGMAPGVTLAFELPLVLGFRLGNKAGISHLLPLPSVSVLYNL